MIIAGIGSLGHALLEHLPLAANGYQILAGFDVDPKLIGQKINGVPILNSEDFGSFIQNNKPAICILTVPTSAAVDYAKQASENGVAAIWNFANVDLSTLGLEAAVEKRKTDGQPIYPDLLQQRRGINCVILFSDKKATLFIGKDAA